MSPTCISTGVLNKAHTLKTNNLIPKCIKNLSEIKIYGFGGVICQLCMPRAYNVRNVQWFRTRNKSIDKGGGIYLSSIFKLEGRWVGQTKSEHYSNLKSTQFNEPSVI